jgi:hypothetical protein
LSSVSDGLTFFVDFVGGDLERYCADEHLTSIATVCNILGTVPNCNILRRNI